MQNTYYRHLLIIRNSTAIVITFIPRISGLFSEVRFFCVAACAFYLELLSRFSAF